MHLVNTRISITICTHENTEYINNISILKTITDSVDNAHPIQNPMAGPQMLKNDASCSLPFGTVSMM